MSGLRERVAYFLAEREGFITAINNCTSDKADYWRWQGNAEARRVLGESLERGGVDLAAVAPAPVADRQRLAEVLDPDAFDESKPRSKHHAAVVQWAARQHMAYQGADRLLAAGVFRSQEITDEMVERAAKAIYEHDLLPGDWPWDKLGQDAARLSRGRVALEAALRAGEPS